MKRAILTVVLITIAGAAPAQNTKPFSIADVLSAPFPDDLIVAAAKSRLAWTADADGVHNIWVAEGPSFSARQLTRYSDDDGVEIGELSFTPDGEWIVFTRGGDLHMGGETANPMHRADLPEQVINIVSVRDGEVRKIADGNSPRLSPKGDRISFVSKRQVMTASLTGAAMPLISIASARNTFRWSPDGSKLAFVAARREHSFIGVVDVTSKSVRYLDPSVDRDSFPVWSPDGKQIAFVRVPSRNEVLAFAPEREGQPWSIRVADPDSGTGREIWRADDGIGSVYHGISAPDQIAWAGDRIVFPWEKDGWLHLYSIPSSGGKAQLLTPGDFEVEYVTVAPDGRDVLYNSNQNDIDRRHLWRVAANGSTRPVAVTSGRGIEWMPRFIDANTIALVHSDARMPARVAVISGSAAPRDLAPLPAQFPAASLVVPEQVIFAAADGMKIHGQLFLPPSRGNERHPAVVFFHGGSRRQMLLGWHYRGYYHNSYAMNQYLASRGYVVLSVNYRSGIGYGMQFREAEHYGTGGASEVNDIIGAALYLRSRNDVDPDRIGAWGGSYGGYMTAFALAKASELYAAGVDFHGVHDWNNEIKVWEPTYDPAAHQELARLAWQSSPMAYVETWKSPVLLIHGDDDRNVSFNETIHLVEQLRKHHVDVEQLVFPDEIHEFLLHRDWVTAYEATASFFDRKLRAQRSGN